MDIKMFLPWLLLAQVLSSVGGKALTTQGGSLFPGTEGTAGHHTTRGPPITEKATLLTLRERSDQTSAVTASTDQYKSSDHLSTGAPTFPGPTEVTSGKTKPTTFETISTTAEEKGSTLYRSSESSGAGWASKGSTLYRSSESSGAGRASKDDGVDQKKQENVFYYDYHTLRVHGLICALVFFVTGILIIVCERFSCASCCRKKKESRLNDEVTRL